MAELIDKGEALKLFDNCAFQTMNYVTVKGRLNSLPTTNEAEIRAKAIDEAMGKLAEEICTGCGCLKDRKCTYKGSNCRVSKIMLEKTMKVLEQLKGDK